MPVAVRWGLLALFAGLLLGAGWWLGRQAPAAIALSSEASPSALERNALDPVDDLAVAAAPRIEPPPVTDTMPVAGTGTAAAALPPRDTPLASVFDDVLDRARRGDARAACWLASELERCRAARLAMQQSERMEDWAARQDNSRRREAMIEHLARLQNEQQRAESVCADLPEAHFDLAFALQLQAARAMPELRVWAASNPALDTQNFVNELARWEEYRRIALPWLQAAAEEGDLAALIVLARIHGDSRRPGPQTPPFRQIDDAAFVHYANVLERRGVVLPRLQSAASEARNRLDADTLARVQDMTDALAAKQPSAVPDDAAIRQAMRRSFSDTHEAVDCDPR